MPAKKKKVDSKLKDSTIVEVSNVMIGVSVSKKAHDELRAIAKEVRIQNKIPMTKSGNDIIQDIVAQLITQYVRQNMKL